MNTTPAEPASMVGTAMQGPRSGSVLPEGFDVVAWTRAACEASGVSFAVTDPVALRIPDRLMKHPA